MALTLTQTTLAVDETVEIVGALRDTASDDICYATTNRQDALKAIAEESDLVLVIGSANSSTSVRLVELAHRHDTPSHLIDDPSHIRQVRRAPRTGRPSDQCQTPDDRQRQ